MSSVSCVLSKVQRRNSDWLSVVGLCGGKDGGVTSRFAGQRRALHKGSASRGGLRPGAFCAIQSSSKVVRWRSKLRASGGDPRWIASSFLCRVRLCPAKRDVTPPSPRVPLNARTCLSFAHPKYSGRTDCGSEPRCRSNLLRRCGSEPRWRSVLLRCCSSEPRCRGNLLRRCGSVLRCRSNLLRRCGSELRCQSSLLRRCGSELRYRSNLLRRCSSEPLCRGNLLRRCGSELRGCALACCTAGRPCC